MLNGVKDSIIVSLADNRLTYRNEKDRKKRYKSGKKLFKIEYLNATVSFFGSLQIINEKNNCELLCDWMPKFIQNRHAHTKLIDFGNDLRNELNKRSIKDHLRMDPSGVHLCGYRQDGVPEFMHFSNCSIRPDGFYDNILDSYKDIEEDFLGRDAIEFGWDGTNPESIIAENRMRLYRNGDVRAHSAAWEKLDEVFQIVFTFNDFKRPYSSSNEDIRKLIKQKLTFISALYNAWSTTKMVGAPWDIIILRPKKEDKEPSNEIPS